MERGIGELVDTIYRALTYGLSPLINLHLRWRKFRGLEHHLRWRERLGVPSLPRPPGPLIWFHAVSLGEGMAAIPVINCCVQRRPDVTVLMTTTTASAFNVIKKLLPGGVIYQAFVCIPTRIWLPCGIYLWFNVIYQELQREGVSIALRSRSDTLTPGTSIYVVDTLGELRNFYRLVPIAVIRGSLLSGFTGHNISEAAAGGCAVLTGPHLGHFSHMAMAMRQLNPSSVQQVTGRQELEEVFHLLLSSPEVLEARRVAAKEAFQALSYGVVENV